MARLLPTWLQNIVMQERVDIGERTIEDRKLEKDRRRDFELEWLEHQHSKSSKTWGFQATERLEQLFLETALTAEELKGLIVMDAGCGNGLLTEAISDSGARVLGVDIINNLHVVTSERTCSDNLQFLQASLLDLPLNPSSFDLVISNGVLHHTPDTKQAFLELSRFVKPGGKMYTWLYRRPFRLKNRFLLAGADILRFFVSRMTTRLQKITITGLARLFHFLGRLKRGARARTYEDILLDVYDSFTPRYRHYHHPIEVAGWFYEAGFGSPVLSHWDNSFGFGLCATKMHVQSAAAGENFGKESRDAELHLR